jgi:hypothetical protein
MDKIFISIASYRDKLLATTINDAYNKAKFKDSLVFGVFEQANDNEKLNLNQFDFRKQIIYANVDPKSTKGVCWARKNIQKMVSDESYFLQIDAHTLFDDAWDQTLINHLNEIKKYHSKPILTGYPNSFNPETFVKQPLVPNTICSILNLEERNHLFSLNGFHPPVGNFTPTIHNIVHGYHIGACFMFSDASLVKEVPYDDAVFFGGEEIIISMRAWTSGYNIFHLSKIPLNHCWDKSYGGVVQRDYAPGHTEKIQQEAKEHISKLVRNQLAAPYGLGTVRSIDDYMKYSGLDFYNYDFKLRMVIFETPYSDPLPV